MAERDPYAALAGLERFVAPLPAQPPTLAEVRAHREALLAAARSVGAAGVWIAGSVARGDARRGSDVDFLVALPPGYTLLDLGGLNAAFERILGRAVDVVERESASPPVRAAMCRDAVPL